MTVDRAALIEAAAEVIDKQLEDDSYGPNRIAFSEYFGERAGWAVLQAVLPLIANAIEAEGRQVVQSFEPAAAGRPGSVEMGRLIGAEDAYKHAIRLVRSLGGNDGSSDA